MPDLHYDDPALAQLYDISCGWSEDRDFYLGLAGDRRANILDLGCGTGLLCTAYADRGHDVTGADPSPAMLAEARNKPYGTDVDWVLASAQDFRSEKRFDLIIMTGHAFQVLLGAAEIAAAFATMRMHLKPDGRAVFESRNPTVDWAAKWDGEQTAFVHHGAEIRKSTHVRGWNGPLLTFEQHFHLPQRTLVSTSHLRFPSLTEIEAHITRAGLAIDALYGDWLKHAFDPRASEEMVFSVSLA
jgi:SAM-dependent methyltransferase